MSWIFIRSTLIKKCSPIKLVNLQLTTIASNSGSIFVQGLKRPHNFGIRYESSLAKLRKKTGYAFALCRKALEENDQDVTKAEKWLRAEAAKQGWEKAERVKSRTTGQGLIGIYTREDQRQSTMVEVKCETDFVARNDNFVKLVSDLAKTLSQYPISNHQTNIQKNWIMDEQKLTEIGGKMIVEAIQKLGENIRFVRGCIVRVPDGQNDVHLMPYTHAVAGKIESSDKDVSLGKYGTIVAITQKSQQPTEETNEEIDTTQISNNIEELGSRLGQHIIGLSPKTVNRVLNSEQKQEDSVGDEEPEDLLRQKFIFNDEITVGEYLKNSGAQVLDFVRFECGEEFESDK